MRELLGQHTGMAHIFSTSCHTGDHPLVKLVYSAEHGQYLSAGEVDTSEVPNERNLLRNKNGSFGGQPQDPIVLQQGQRSAAAEDPDGHVIFGKLCDCARDEHVYCPVGAELCKISTPNSYTYRIWCEGDTQDMFARYMFPFVLFLFLFLGCLLCGSPKGRHALGYARKVVRRWDQERYQQALQHDLERMAAYAQRRQQRLLRLQQHAARSSNRIYEGHSPTANFSTLNGMAQVGSPQRRGAAGTTSTEATLQQVANRRAVVLKTQIYQVPKDDKDDDAGELRQVGSGETTCCTICLQPLEAGDRVGDLACAHVFHVDCLKSWIQRKNHCPLCQAQNLAQPQQHATEGNGDESGGGGVTLEMTNTVTAQPPNTASTH